MRPKSLLAAVLSILTVCSSAYSQDAASAADDALLDECERAVIELRHRRAESAGLTAQVAAQGEIIAALEKKAAVLESIVTNLEAANAARRDASAKDDEIKASFQRSLDAATERIRQLETELARVKGQRKWYAVVGAFLGAAAAVAVDKD